MLENRLHSLYDSHSDGSGVCYSSARRPLLTMRPGYNKASLWFDAPHQLNEDLCITDWLEQQDQGYDVLTDQILHHDGRAALAPYRVLMTGSHPEYWSEPMLDAVEAFWLAVAGSCISAGMDYIGSPPSTRPGRTSSKSAWHRRHANVGLGRRRGLSQHDRRTGRDMAPARPSAAEARGRGVHGARAGPIRALSPAPGERNPRAQFIFEGVEGDVFGAGGLHLGAAGGYEMDRADVALGTPPHALVLASSFGHSDNYQHCIEEMLETDGLQGGTRHPAARSHLAFFDIPAAARFPVGSISWSGSLSHQS